MKSIDKGRVRELTTKGLSQAKIARMMGVRKSRIGVVQATLGAIRPQPKGLSLFHQDVRTRMRMEELPYGGKEGALRFTADTRYWSGKRLAIHEKALKPYMDRFQAGKPETKAQKKRRHALQNKLQSIEARAEWSRAKQEGRKANVTKGKFWRPDDPEDPDDPYEEW